MTNFQLVVICVGTLATLYALWLVLWVAFLWFITRRHGHDGSKYPPAELERLRTEGF